VEQVRYEPGAYADLDRTRTLAAVRADGWEPAVFADPPGAVYPPHRHPETKLLAFLAGSMDVRVAGCAYRCGPGDKLVIPGGVEHAALVGPDGCTFVWSEQVRNPG
jgi:quercetin dioxygenase-like cupin family protein